MERLVSEITKNVINRGNDEREKIQNINNVDKIIEIMKQKPDIINHMLIIEKLLNKKVETIPKLLGELKNNYQNDIFIELAIKTIFESKIDCNNEVIDIVLNGERNSYLISLLCIYLGYKCKNEKCIKILWDYYHFFKARYPEENYKEGPLLGLLEIYS